MIQRAVSMGGSLTRYDVISIFSNHPEAAAIRIENVAMTHMPLTAALVSSVIYACLFSAAPFALQTSNRSHRTYVWQGVVLTAVCGVMIICVDTVRTTSSVLIVGVICLSTVTRTLVSVVSRVLRN